MSETIKENLREQARIRNFLQGANFPNHNVGRAVRRLACLKRQLKKQKTP